MINTSEEMFETHQMLGNTHKLLQEYMKSFSLVGYASDGSPVVLEFAPTPMDASAITKLTESLLEIRTKQEQMELLKSLSTSQND